MKYGNREEEKKAEAKALKKGRQQLQGVVRTEESSLLLRKAEETSSVLLFPQLPPSSLSSGPRNPLLLVPSQEEEEETTKMATYELVRGDDTPTGYENGADGHNRLLRVEEGFTGREALEPRSAAIGATGDPQNVFSSSPSKMKKCPSKQQLQQQKQKQQQQRLVSLDVFRGVTVALMILVDNAGGLFPAISHSPWDGVTLADFVMPFFLFIVGLALGLCYKNVPSKTIATRKAVLRALKLFTLGLVLQGGYFHGINNLTYGVDLSTIRWMGILQRIAIAYLIVALCEIWLQADSDVDSGLSLVRKYRFQLLVGLLLTAIYLGLLYGLYVPDWEYQLATKGSERKTFLVKCGLRGNTGPGCNAVGFIDRKILGIKHLYRRPVYARTKQCSMNSPRSGPLPPDAPAWCRAPFDPEGILSSMMAVVTCLIGLQFGHVILHFKDHKDRISKWVISSFALLTVASLLVFCGMHMNKVLYSVSYTLATAGAAGVLFTGFYILVDVYGFRRLTAVMEWVGVHALSIFILVACNVIPIMLQGFYWKEPGNNMLSLIGIGSR